MRRKTDRRLADRRRHPEPQASPSPESWCYNPEHLDEDGQPLCYSGLVRMLEAEQDHVALALLRSIRGDR